MLNLFSAEMRRNPYPVYEQIRGRSPVLYSEPLDLWMLFDYEGVKRALSDPDVFSSRATPPGSSGSPPDWFIFYDPPRHTKLRGLIQKAFTPRVIASLELSIRQLSKELLDQAIGQTTGQSAADCSTPAHSAAGRPATMDLAADFSVPLAIRVIASLIGIPPEDHPQFRRWSDVILSLSETVTRGADLAKIAGEVGAVKVEMGAYLADLLEERRRAPRDDLLSTLSQAEVDGERLTTAEILGFFQLLLVAGNETTANLINNAVLCLIENRDQLARLRPQRELLPSAIEEVLRYCSPVQAVFRVTKRDVEVHGQLIPAGKLVLPMIGSANRDPRQFPDANRFDITRDPNPHIAFGNGIHFCIGAALSRLEARIGLTDLLDRLHDIELASDDPWEPRQAFHVHGPNRLPIRFRT
ncbi:MAG TPA: cytochrome P450 [Planctomycetaceae bacterium]|jgi:cytochrome P450|nr:cytochrome P450 [Planctomycetaceae bacterium]